MSKPNEEKKKKSIVVKEGGNAVVNIVSNYKNKETSSETEYMCGNGALMAGVALKGTVIKTGK